MIAIGKISTIQWITLQMSISGGHMRILHAEHWDRAINLVQNCYEKMKNYPKLQMQVKYFEREAENITSSETAKQIIQAVFQRLEIPTHDTQIIIEGFPTISHVIDATDEEMESNCPADSTTIHKITSFFGCNTPTLSEVN